MVTTLRRPVAAVLLRWVGVAGRVALAVMLCAGTVSRLAAQAPQVPFRHNGDISPGAIGTWQLLRGGPLPGYFQPVEIEAPPGAEISLAEEGAFGERLPGPRSVGLLIGAVYRIRVTRIPQHPGEEVYPTIELIDRIYPPPGQEVRFPLPLFISQADLELALEGKYVTRVIYLEDPDFALGVAQTDARDQWFDVGPGEDPLHVADALGRPVAILRMGGRVPNGPDGMDAAFLGCSPPYIQFTPRQMVHPLTAAASATGDVPQTARESDDGDR